MKTRGLILAGGDSSRMGQDKSSLVFQGETLRKRIFNALRSELDEVFLSARSDSKFLSEIREDQNILFDDYKGIGPAAGLLSAFDFDPHGTWFVIACDFPLVTQPSVSYLLQAHRKHSALLTCYLNAAQVPEPLFALWTGEALRLLRENVLRGETGPSQTLKKIKSQQVSTPNNQWLFNANTAHDWKQIVREENKIEAANA